MGRKIGTKYIIAIITVIVIIYLSFTLLLVFSLAGFPEVSRGKKIAQINIKGPIAASGSDGPFTSAVTPESVISQLEQAVEDDNIKAVLLRVNSPGGTSAAGQEIYAGK